LILLVVCAVPAFATANAYADVPYFHDSAGRIVIYHGINVSNYAKTVPDHLSWHTKEDFARLRDWGFNLVRYLVFWEAIEPVEGQYDEAYLDATAERIRWMKELGIDVLLDLHQDLYCAKYTGNGLPVWTADDDGIPFRARSPWNLNYVEPAVVAAYTNLWQSAPLKAKYVAMLEHLMRRVEGLPNVAGIDVMNEPFPAWDFRFEREVLSPLYQDMLDMRARNGFKTPLFFEPEMFTSAGLSTGLKFAPPPDCGYAPHYYDPLCHEGVPYTCVAKFWMKVTVWQRLQDARRLGMPILFGEFGVDSSKEGHLDLLGDFLDLADAHRMSWAYYSYDKASHETFSITDDDGNEKPQLTRLVCVYAQRIAGERPEFQFGKTSFGLAYDSIDTPAPTIVFVPAHCQDVQVEFNGHAVPFEPGMRYLELVNEGKTGTRQTLQLQWEIGR
jgi:endoglycosylceramidase